MPFQTKTARVVIFQRAATDPLVGTETSSGGGREAIPRLNSVYTILAIPSATLTLQNESA